MSASERQFPQMSIDSVMANVAVFAGELIRRGAMHVVNHDAVPLAQVRVPLPFSRAAAADYLRIVELWSAYRETTPIAAPPRPCPACRASSSELAFVSYDHYPYHECRQCGTWFVPLRIDDAVIDAFFDAVPEARQLADRMMAGRDEGTRDNDRQRFAEYFTLLNALTGGGRVRYLDIGSGVGHAVELAAEYGWEASGVEVNPVAVRTARAKGRDVRLPEDLASAGKYRVVSLFETLEHITDPDPVLAEVAQRLAPGGVVIITVPNRASFEMQILRGRCFHIFGGSENVGHINLFDTRGLEALLGRHGLSVAFTDGQFSSDFPQIFSFLTSVGPAATRWEADGFLELAIPEMAHTVLNNLGPVLACLERALKRSPILLAVACRASERAALATAFAELEQRWRADMQSALDDVGQTLTKHESEFRALLAVAQQDVLERDALLAETESRLQQEIARRDRLIAEAALDFKRERNRFDRTVEGRLLRLVKAVARVARQAGVLPGGHDQQ